MGVFMDRYREVLELRRQQRRYQQELEFAQHKAKQMFDGGATASEVTSALAPYLGCPCGGPGWWRDIVIRAHREEGITLPPELQEA